MSTMYDASITEMDEDSAGGDCIEDLSESSGGAMDAMLLAPTIQYRQKSPNSNSGHQHFTELSLKNPDCKEARAHSVPIPSSPHHNRGHSPQSDFNSPASFRTACSPASFISARSTYNSPADMSASGYNSAMMLEPIREDELPAAGLSVPLLQLHNEYYASLHQQDIIQSFSKELN
jgi:hypothetical protein